MIESTIERFWLNGRFPLLKLLALLKIPTMSRCLFADFNARSRAASW